MQSLDLIALHLIYMYVTKVKCKHNKKLVGEGNISNFPIFALLYKVVMCTFKYYKSIEIAKETIRDKNI